MNQAPVTIVWFRQDLRLADNPALLAAVERANEQGGAVVPVYIWSPEEEGGWAAGGARRWWLHHSLRSLDQSLKALGSQLVLREGPTQEVLEELITQTSACAVFWNRRYEPASIERDQNIKRWLRDERSIAAESFNSHLLYEPWEIETGGGGPYKVFSPFWRNAKNQPTPDLPREAPESIPAPSQWPASVVLEALGLEPTRDWKDGLAEAFTPGEPAAQEKLDTFLDDAIRQYKDDRNFPAKPGTSKLSPHLVHGEISPRQCYHAARKFMADGRRNLSKDELKQCEHYVQELGWREFAYHVLYHFPETPREPLQKKYARFPWKEDAEHLKNWQRGQTGYPIIDAGMRELYATGWMHNRVRMIVASFLVKDLLISWEQGAEWFWDTLLDADLANNTLGWQWAGGCGADAAPYFRIFNPILQGEKFDKDGEYVRQWVPEIAALPDRILHKPWEAPPMQLAAAGITLGETYPYPIVDHKQARDSALAALDAVKGQ
ncbi:cryptochrome/photolyase family protein [Algisphaera agarilytica]|uniref:Deoxyribodipyrimidine photo-lyase n=1 Tax=Algisphaera agarilytica TaxID=1385975 RepID=A0A7X0H9N1_9BACT|nr:deoxyribodipyrimidine photo-lyase [Algisphaera agarilytica]MBB6431662.1 deoxyribodipyrimidine photo-lyase [Algisphaera agarilytica]